MKKGERKIIKELGKRRRNISQNQGQMEKKYKGRKEKEKKGREMKVIIMDD